MRRSYKGPNPAADLKFFLGRQPSQRSRKRDLQWFRQDEARRLLAACRGLKPRWFAFLLVLFGGGLRWGEATALDRSDIDWRRGRLHVQRTWSESGGRLERCKDGEDRRVTLPRSAIAALRAHCEAMELEASLKEWRPEQRQLVFPNTVGGVTRYGAFHELVWQPLLRAAALPYRKPHAMRHSYATGCSRPVRTSAGSRTRWATPRSARRKGPTGTSCANVTSGTSTTSMRCWGRSTRWVTAAERSSPTTPSVPPRPPATHLRLVMR